MSGQGLSAKSRPCPKLMQTLPNHSICFMWCCKIIVSRMKTQYIPLPEGGNVAFSFVECFFRNTTLGKMVPLLDYRGKLRNFARLNGYVYESNMYQ